MKILILIYRLGRGGAQRLVLDICEELNNRKNIEYKLVVFDPMDLYPEYRETVPRELCDSWVELSLSGKNKVDVSSLQSIMDEFKPDVIHSHLFIPELISRACVYPHAAWFTHMHDNMSSLKKFSAATLFNKELFTNHFEKRFILEGYKKNGGNNFITISQDAYDYTNNNLSGFNIDLLPNAVNTKKFSCPKVDEKGIGDTIKLINVGSFHALKNQQLLVEIGARMNEKGIKFEIHFVGDGRDRTMIEGLVEERRLKDHVYFHGTVENTEDYLCNSDIYVHTSTHEAFGLVLIEAMATGLPVVTLDGKGNRELIDEGKNGYMIYEQNPDLFVDKIMALAKDRDLYKKMSKNALHFSKKYDIHSYVDQLLDLYRSRLKNITN